MPVSSALFVALIATTLGMFISSNKLLFGLNTGPVQKHAELIHAKDDVLDYYLEKHHKQLGNDFVRYRNHCLRVLAFTRYHLAEENIPINPRLHNIIAMALGYHDIALWTDHELNYLEPSADQMQERVQEEMKLSHQQEVDEGTGYIPMNLDWSAFEEDSELARVIILQHHKYTSYHHNSTSKMEHFDAVVNAVRKADWADATMGLVRFGLPQSFLGAAYKAIPEAGFHEMLLKMAPRLSPESVRGQMEVLKILKW